MAADGHLEMTALSRVRVTLASAGLSCNFILSSQLLIFNFLSDAALMQSTHCK